ncbi:DUF3887 domain-containing protein [Chryseobacterium sp. MMS23-Vi53]|uniref:alpha/beta hydrolase n=1 Tax=Chryseobacterium sp. MMS23-Vi53 TaxID=3386644 RepID=UPI0039EAA173
MKKILSLVLFFTALFSFAQNRKEIGDQFIKLLFIDNNTEKAYTFFDPEMAKHVTPEVFKTLPEQLEGQFGNFKNVIEVNNESDAYYYYSEFEKEKLDILINFTDSNKIIGFFLVPHKNFDKPDDKTALRIKSDSIELKGTLLEPEENNQKKLVILVHGSGASDRDETIGENKPFRDIAEYLLKNGISSYRYDKRTNSNPEAFNEKSTVEQETINDAVNVSNYFKNNEKFKDYQIIILGHSLGAYLMPKIAEKANASKYVFMAGNARPLQDVLLRQFEYLHSIDPSNVSEKDLQDMKKKVDFLNSKKFNLNTPKEELPMVLSAAYWKYLVDYKPLESVKLIKVPMFFAQGGMDYQVIAKDYVLWKEQLKNNKLAEFKFYQPLGHLFIKISGTPSPKNYEIKGNVDGGFLKDLVQFILK